MARSEAATVKEYLDQLPPERRKVMSTVRSFVRKHVPKGYAEVMNWGMICWQIPLKRFPDTYNGQPLCYAALAAQKNNYTLHLMGAYVGTKENPLKAAYEAAGKKLDMGKSCLHFKKVDDLVPDAIAELIARMPPDSYIELFEASRKAGRKH